MIEIAGTDAKDVTEIGIVIMTETGVVGIEDETIEDAGIAEVVGITVVIVDGDGVEDIATTDGADTKKNMAIANRQ